MNNNSEYDERQQLERGKAFRNGYFTLLIMLGINLFAKELFKIDWLDNLSEFLLCFWVSFTVCTITLILKNAYDGIEDNRGKMISAIFGLVGIFLIAHTAFKLITKSDILYNRIGFIITGSACIILCIVYWAKYFYDKKHEKEN